MGSNLLGCALQEILILLAQAIQCQKELCLAALRYALMVDVVLRELREVLTATGTESGQ